MSVLRSVVYTPVSRRGHSGGIPNRADVIAYFKIVDGVLTDSIGLSSITITVVSGSDASDLVITVAGATSYGIAEATEYTWVEFQDECDGNGYIFTGSKGCLVYSSDMSADENKILKYLGMYTGPMSFSFITQIGIELGATGVESNTITVPNIVGTRSFTITGGTFKINSAAYGTTGDAVAGDTITLKGDASTTLYEEQTNVVLTCIDDSATSTFTFNTRAATYTVGQFTIPAKTGQELDTLITSAVVEVTGMEMDGIISVTGGLYRINETGDFTTVAGIFPKNGSFEVQIYSNDDCSQTETATVTINSVSADFDVTTSATTSVPVLNFDETTIVDDKTIYLLTSSFAEISFNTEATEIVVDYYANASTAVDYRLGVYIDDVFLSAITVSAVGLGSAAITLDSGNKKVTLINSGQTDPGNDGVPEGTFITSMTANQKCTMVTPKTITDRLVVYGDSITMGDGSTLNVEDAWTMLVRNQLRSSRSIALDAWGYRSLHTDAINSTARAAFIDELVASGATDFWFAIGTNDYGLNKWSASAFGTAYAAVLDELHIESPNAIIYCQTPITRTTETANASGSTLGDYRSQIAMAVSTRESYCVLVDGSEIMTTAFLADGVHPTTAGHAIYASYVLDNYLDLEPDEIPNQFVFTDVIGKEPGTGYWSNPVTITGINVPVTASATGAYRINGGSVVTGNNDVVKNDTIELYVVAPAFEQSSSNTLTVGTVFDTYTVASRVASSTPDAFEFTDQTGVTVDTLTASDAITVSGIDVNVTISITSGTGEYQINTGSWTSSSGTVSNGDTVKLRLTSSSSESTQSGITLLIGGVTDTWSVTTESGTITASEYAAIIEAENNLLYYWPMQEASGQSSLASSVGSKTITLRNSPATGDTGFLDKAVTFSKTTSQNGITSTTLNLAYSKIVVECLVKSPSSVADEVLFESSENAATSTLGFVLLSSNSAPQTDNLALLLKGVTGLNYSYYPKPSTDQWHLVTAIFDKGSTNPETTLYVDGVLVSSVLNPGTYNNTNNFSDNLYFHIFARGTNTFPASGSMSDLAIYTDLSAERILVHAQALGLHA